MGVPVCRIGDEGDHGGVITTGSPNVYANGRRVARVGDTYECLIHGPNPLATGSATVHANGRRVVRIGDTAECGAAMITGSPNVYVG